MKHIMPHQKRIRLGTRGSKLALVQAGLVREALERCHAGLQVEIVPIKTTGDTILDRNLADIGGKGLFIKEIEEALLDSRVDIAVHSMKDMPADLPEGLHIPCVLEREDAADAFISVRYASIEALPQGAVVGSSSSRRAAQLLALRPDIRIEPFRGNVQTRLEKLKTGEVDATFLAVAGLNRLAMEKHITQKLSYQVMLPAVAQGAIGVECRKGDSSVEALLAPLNHLQTAECVKAERGFLAEFDGSCRTPLGAHAVLENGQIFLTCMVAAADGRKLFRESASIAREEAAALGKKLGMALKEKALSAGIHWVKNDER